MIIHLLAMGRRKRPYQPGTIFHLVSRTHRRQPWFTPVLRTQIVGLIQQVIPRTDARLLAYAVMPNHLHIIVRQGRTPLAGSMQPLLRRVALRVQHHHGLAGGIFERRFRDQSCVTPDHVRDAIIYTHLNPWRAGLCGDDLAYEWTSHTAYLPGSNPTEYGIQSKAQLSVLKLFAGKDHHSRDALCAQYEALLHWRMHADVDREAHENESDVPPLPARPATDAGDAVWARARLQSRDRAVRYVTAAGRDAATMAGPLPDLRDFILIQIDRLAPGRSVAELTGSWLERRLARERMQLVRAATDRGYRTTDIARFFRISSQTVSRIKYDERT